MNYLSHYYADGQYDRHYFNFGLVLPDLVGASQRGWRASGSGYPWQDAIEINDIWLGYNSHVAADAYFHSSVFFKDNTLAIRHIFEGHGLRFPGVRLFFVAHVFLEMIMDRLIILHHPDVAASFYTGLGLVHTNKVEQFFHTSGSILQPRFLEVFEKFREHKFLYTYIDDERLFFALNRIMGRARQEPFKEEHLPAFSQAIKDTERLLQDQYIEMLEKIKALNTNR